MYCGLRLNASVGGGLVIHIMNVTVHRGRRVVMLTRRDEISPPSDPAWCRPASRLVRDLASSIVDPDRPGDFNQVRNVWCFRSGGVVSDQQIFGVLGNFFLFPPLFFSVSTSDVFFLPCVRFVSTFGRLALT